MGDSTCLLRSFSHPSTSSLQPQQVDPIRALTESVSFGRFMSEPLAWEKWSTFSHNHILEEVQQFAKPGSVAQKRAFFEAHYKKRAAMRAAALAEEASRDGSLQSENADPMSLPGETSVNAKSPVVVGDDQQPNYLPDTDETETIGVAARNPSTNEGNDIIPNPEISEHNVIVEIPAQVEVYMHLVKSDGHDMIAATPETNMSYKGSADQKKSTSSTKRRRTMSSRSLTESGASKVAASCPMQTTPIKANNGNNIVQIGQKSAEDSNNKREMIPTTLHTSINFTSCSVNASKSSFKVPTGASTLSKVKKMVDLNSLALPNNKGQTNSTLKSSAYGSRIRNNGILVSKESVCDSNEKRRVVSKSNSKNVNCSKFVSKSIDFTSHVSNFSRKAVKIPRESSTVPQIPNRASVNAEPKPLASDMLSEDRSCSKSPSVSKAHAITKSSPFRFRSEERAERRKEFFQKVEEKSNSMKTEKQDPQTRFKGHTSNMLNKLWQSSEAKLHEDLNRGTQSSSNQTKKIPLVRPWPSKAGVNQSSSRLQDANSRPLPPRMPAMKTDGSTYVWDKNRRRNFSSVTSIPKIRHENASPNIQLPDSEGISCKHKNSGSVGG